MYFSSAEVYPSIMCRFGRVIIHFLPFISLLAACSIFSPPQNTGISSTHASSPPPTLSSATNSSTPTNHITKIPEPSLTTPVPSPAPAIKLWIDPHLPSDLYQLILSNLGLQSIAELTPDADIADIRIQVSDQNVLTTWVYALVAPFPTVTDAVTLEDIHTAWGAESSNSDSNQLLMMEDSTHAIFTQLWGEPDSDSVKILPHDDLLDFAWENRSAWALIPFDDLEPRWKVLEVDGQSPIRKDFDANNYPLTVPIGYAGNHESVLNSGIESWHLPISNRIAEKLTTLSLTGVTALVRGTALTMERRGMTYPALDIGDILRNSDLTHVNNEVPFTPDCPFPELNPTSLVFCSKPVYIELLDDIGTDIIELSGDHFADQGPEAMYYTLEMYAQRGWKLYGGGVSEKLAREPILIDHNGNRIAFLGCNIGCEIKTEISCKALAQGDQPGAATCDFEWLDEQIKQLTDQGYNVVFTFQHKEYYTYIPQPDLIRDFRQVSLAGATIVSGSQAHQPHALAFENGTFIHYGLGNLFFDQYNYCVDNACNDGFIDRHVFYDNHHISTELITIRFIDMARPRLMTPEERTNFLNMIFQVSGW
jgi:hypothetical protein